MDKTGRIIKKSCYLVKIPWRWADYLKDRISLPDKYIKNRNKDDKYFDLSVVELFASFGVQKSNFDLSSKNKLIIDVGTNFVTDFVPEPEFGSKSTISVSFPVVLDGPRNLTLKEKKCYSGISGLEEEGKEKFEKNVKIKTNEPVTKNADEKPFLDFRRFYTDGTSLIDSEPYFVLGFEANPGTWLMSQKFDDVRQGAVFNPKNGAILPIAISENREVVKMNVDDGFNTCDSIVKTKKPPTDDLADLAVKECIKTREKLGILKHTFSPSRQPDEIIKYAAVAVNIHETALGKKSACRCGSTSRIGFPSVGGSFWIENEKS